MQLASPCYGEKLVVDVHAILFWLWCRVSVKQAGKVGGGGGDGGGVCLAGAYLVAWIHVEPSPEAMIPTAIFHVVAVLSGHGQSVVGGKHGLAVW